MRRNAGRAGGLLHVVTSEPRPRDEAAVGAPLDWPEDPTALPYLDGQGNLILPLGVPRKFRWWAGGQSVRQTMVDLGGGRS